MISIFDKNAQTWKGIGEGVLLPSSCVIKEELNGVYELVMKHPYDESGKWKRIENQKIIYADTPRGKQPFRIYQIIPNMNEITINARHLFYDLLDNLIINTHYHVTGKSFMLNLNSWLAYPTNFIFDSDILTSQDVDMNNINPVAALLDNNERNFSFIKAFGGELKRDRWKVEILNTIGNDNNVRIAYGKNLIGLEVTEDNSSVVTRIYPVGKDGLTISGRFVDSPRINDYVNPKIYVLEDAQIETEAALRAAAQKIFDNGGDLPQVNIKVDFEILSKTDEYKNYAILEQVYLGDIVTVINQKMNFYKRAKVISYEWDSILNRYNSIELGDFLPTLVSSVTTGVKSVSSIASTNATINTHITDYNNPHRVTTAQIGAATQTQVTALETNLIKRIEYVTKQFDNMIDIPANSNLAEYFKTAQTNTLYRVRANIGISNTCVTNTQYSWYVYDGTHIKGYDFAGNFYTCNFVNKQFTTWQQIATVQQLNAHITNYSNPHKVTAVQVGAPTTQVFNTFANSHIVRTYTDLSQIGLSDDQFSADDYTANLNLINNAIGYNATILMLTASTTGVNPNLANSILKRLTADNVISTPFSMFMVKIERYNDAWRNIKVEIMLEDYSRDTVIIGYANRDGNTMNVYPFKVMAATQKVNLTFLNGWRILGDNAQPVAIKSGNFVYIYFGAQGGTRTNGTQLFTLPQGFRPDRTSTMALINQNNLTWARIVAYTDGRVLLLDAQNTTGAICGMGGFVAQG